MGVVNLTVDRWSLKHSYSVKLHRVIRLLTLILRVTASMAQPARISTPPVIAGEVVVSRSNRTGPRQHLQSAAAIPIHSRQTPHKARVHLHCKLTLHLRYLDSLPRTKI